MARPSVMKHNFSQIPRANIPRSRFDRSHGYKTTFDSGYLVPFFLDEVLPGDTFSLSANLFARLSTPIVPFMDNLFLETFFFFVPNRLVWDHWQEFNGEQKAPEDSTDYLIPQHSPSPGSWEIGSVADYFGLPLGIAGDEYSVSALPFRAYNLIWNEWFRDQNLQNPAPVFTGDGPDPLDYEDPYTGEFAKTYSLRRRGKRHDYFTSCLPWPQKGPGVELPLGSSLPIEVPSIPVSLWGNPTGQTTGNITPISFRTLQLTNPPNQPPSYAPSGADFRSSLQTEGEHNVFTDRDGGGVVNDFLSFGSGSLPINMSTVQGQTSPSTVVANLDQASAATINSLRQAFQIQKLLERDARGGTRYTEILRSHFGVVSPDARLQRPEYLGGSSTRIRVNPVQQTSATGETTPQGNLAAFGVGADSFHGFTKSFVEHGYIIGLVNVRADLTYQQGTARHFSRKTRFDFYWPALAYLGEQAVLNKEIYTQAGRDSEWDDQVFGYQERWAEYRYFPSRITGKFRSDSNNQWQSLDFWHLSQYFENPPVLNAEFIEDRPPVERVLAVQDEPHFLMDTYIRLRCARPMPVYSVPGLIDHF